VSGSSGFAVGAKLTAADLTIYYFLTTFFDNKVLLHSKAIAVPS
jgi:hypothetical protein